MQMGNKEEKYEKMIKEINVIFHDDEDYSYCLKKTNGFLRMIKNEKANDSNFRFAYVTLSKIYNNMGDKAKALKCIKKARIYLDTSDIAKTILVDWQYAMCYKGINDEKALVYFKKCYNQSSEINDYEFMGGILDEIAFITKSINTMLCAIDIYKSCETSSFINRQNGLDQMYSHLFQLYIYHNKEIEAFKILHNINNKSITNKLMEELNVFKFA